MRVDVPAVSHEAPDVADENEHGRYAERMGLDRLGERPTREVCNGVPQATARTKGEAQRIERAEAEEMFAPRIHDSHRRKPDHPEARLQWDPPQAQTPIVPHPAEPSQPKSG